MKYSNITIKITWLQNKENLIKKYSLQAAKIISRKVSKDDLNTLIKKLEAIKDL